jgi:MbtH protein
MRPLSFRKEADWGAFGSRRDSSRYRVVINHEEQYSIWFADRDVPKGWKDAGFSGSAKECMSRIEEVWTDMRPLSWREHWSKR